MKPLAQKDKSIIITRILLAVIALFALFSQFNKTSDRISVPDVIDVPTFNSTFGSNTDDARAIILEGWNTWRTREEFDGNDFPPQDLTIASNIDLDIKQSIAPRKGTLVLGTASTTADAINSMHTSRDHNGRELLIRTRSTFIDWWNSVDSDWDLLDDGYTANKVFSFADGSTSTESIVYTYFSNGSESLRRFPVAFGTVFSNTSTAVTLNSVTGATTAVDQGFIANGSNVTINSVDYSYTDTNGLILQGLSALPAFDSNEGVIGTVDTTGFINEPITANTLLIKDQRLFAAVTSTVFVSQIDRLKDFSFSAPRLATEGERIFYPEQGGNITALANRGTHIAIFKQDFIGSLEFKDFGENLFDIPVLKTIITETDVGPLNAKSISQKDFLVIYAGNDIGITELTRLANKNFDEPISIMERIRPDAEDYVFTDAAIEIWHKKVVMAVREDSNSTFNDRVILWDTLNDRLSELKINASSFAVFDDKLYYGDSLTTNVRQMFADSYNDDGLPYTVQARTKWYNFGTPYRWKRMFWIFVEGHITQNTEISFKILLDEGGDLTSKEVKIVGTGSYVSSEIDEGVFGPSPFGIRSFSPTSDKGDNLKHFSGWINTFDISDKLWRNLAFDISTSCVDCNFRITRIVPFIEELDDNFSRDNNFELLINPN